MSDLQRTVEEQAAALAKAYAHCKDCCCARSWEALGGQTIKSGSIVEHIEALKAERDQLKERGSILEQIEALKTERDHLKERVTELEKELAKHAKVC